MTDNKKTKLHKCKYCNLEIDEKDLGKYQQLDRKKNPKFRLTKSGEKRPVYFYAHKNCYENKKKQRIAWESLYEYVRNKYFEKIVPSGTVTRLQDLRNGSSRMGGIIQSKQGYSYETILDCFEENEGVINKYISQKSFNTDTQRGNYIMTIIERNIEKLEEKIEAPTQQFTKESFYDQLERKSEFIKKQESMSFNEEENFDILD